MNSDIKRKIMRCTIVAAIFLAVANLQGITSNREAQQIVFMLLMVTLFSLLLKNIWVMLFIAWTVFLYSFFKFTSGSNYLSNIFLGGIFYYLTRISFKKEHVDFFINGLLWFVFLNVSYSVLQVLGYDFFFQQMFYADGFENFRNNMSPAGFMGHQSITAALYAMTIPLIATRGSKWSWAAAIGLFFPLYLQRTSLCFICGIVGLMFVLFYRIRRSIWIGLIVLMMLISFFYIKKVDALGIERLPQWHQVMRDVMIHPVTGWGLDSFANVTPNKDFRYQQQVLKFPYHRDQKSGKLYQNITQITWWDNPHNLYISLFYEFGIIGLFIFCGYIRQNFMRFKYAVKTCNVIGLIGFILTFLGISFGHFPIFLARMAVFIIPAFALYEIATE